MKKELKCTQCNGTGYVMKYVLPNITDLVSCLGCNGTDESSRNDEEFCKCTNIHAVEGGNTAILLESPKPEEKS